MAHDLTLGHEDIAAWTTINNRFTKGDHAQAQADFLVAAANHDSVVDAMSDEAHPWPIPWNRARGYLLQVGKYQDEAIPLEFHDVVLSGPETEDITLAKGAFKWINIFSSVYLPWDPAHPFTKNSIWLTEQRSRDFYPDANKPQKVANVFTAADGEGLSDRWIRWRKIHRDLNPDCVITYWPGPGDHLVWFETPAHPPAAGEHGHPLGRDRAIAFSSDDAVVVQVFQAGQADPVQAFWPGTITETKVRYAFTGGGQAQSGGPNTPPWDKP